MTKTKKKAKDLAGRKTIQIRLVLLLRTFENKKQAQFVPFFNVLRLNGYSANYLLTQNC